jgi:hypothetical protein
MRPWATSHGWSKSSATDVISAIAHNDYRRAAISGFIGRPPRSPDELRRRARLDPEISPVIGFVLANQDNRVDDRAR